MDIGSVRFDCFAQKNGSIFIEYCGGEYGYPVAYNRRNKNTFDNEINKQLDEHTIGTTKLVEHLSCPLLFRSKGITLIWLRKVSMD